MHRGAFDAAIAHRGGTYNVIEEKRHDGTPEDAQRHDVTDELAAYKLAMAPFPGWFGVFYEVTRTTKNEHELAWRAKARGEKPKADVELLQDIFDKMK